MNLGLWLLGLGLGLVYWIDVPFRPVLRLLLLLLRLGLVQVLLLLLLLLRLGLEKLSQLGFGPELGLMTKMTKMMARKVGLRLFWVSFLLAFAFAFSLALLPALYPQLLFHLLCR